MGRTWCPFPPPNKVVSIRYLEIEIFVCLVSFTEVNKPTRYEPVEKILNEVSSPQVRVS